jgi:hypothetical protein
MSAKVLAVFEPVLAALGCGRNPICWVVWGDEPATRYVILVPTLPGLVSCHVRVNLPQEGPRASAKLGRWNRVQLGELAIETQGSHRLISFQVESHVLRGIDAEADAIAAFALVLLGAVDGRLPLEPATAPGGRASGGRTAGRTGGRAGTSRAGATPSKAAGQPARAAASRRPPARAG